MPSAPSTPTPRRSPRPATPGGPRRPLEGIPILVKDNIATGDAQPTTAGALALEGATAVRDATVVTRLREAGAVLLGKTNLTEFANILAVGMPSGYSSLGGQVLNPYAPEVDARGTPFVPPGGSSSGSAVAVAAGLAAAAIGTETSGSLLSPANMNGLVTVKPTVGPDQPRRHRPDRAQPGHRRPDDPHGARRGAAARRARRPRPAGRRHSARARWRPTTSPRSTATGCAAPASACRAIPPIPATTCSTARCAERPGR